MLKSVVVQILMVPNYGIGFTQQMNLEVHFQNFLTSWSSNGMQDGCTTQIWQNTSQTINVLNGLSNGTYYLEVYGKGWGTEDFYDNNSSNNYKATS